MDRTEKRKRRSICRQQVYNTHNGDGSTLKAWLMDTFHNKAFGEIPAGFVSKVGMLTRDDMSLYHLLNL